MKPGTIWWGRVGNSLRLLTKVTNNLRDCQSAVLRVSRDLPWRQDFYEAVDDRRSAFSGERRLMRLQWEDNADPGEFILDELCSKRVRADYWPGQTYAAYLGSRDDILLNDYYVWVTGVHSKTDLVRWAEFITQYEQSSRHMENNAVYIIEYDGTPVETLSVEQIAYNVENYDCRVFSLEAAAELGNTQLRNYQSELALSICGNDPELCYELLLTGEKLLEDPVQTAMRVLAASCSSAGIPFAPVDEQVLQSAAWEATVVLLFPILERYRTNFIAENKTQLAHYLPISNSNGDRVTDPFDLEIGALYYIVKSASKVFSAEHVDIIKLCRKVRNLLAHNKVVPLEDVCKVYTLTAKV